MSRLEAGVFTALSVDYKLNLVYFPASSPSRLVSSFTT